MAELSDGTPPPSVEKAPVPPPPGTMGPPPVGRPSTRKGKRTKRKDSRPPAKRRKKNGQPRAALPQLTPQHMDLLREALRSAWTPYAAQKHFAPKWQVSEEAIRIALRQILAEMAAAREAVPAEERAASVLEGMYAHVRRCVDAYEDTGDAKVLSGVPQTLAQIAKIEAVIAPVKVEHGGEISHALTTGEMPVDKIKARIAELQVKHGFGGTPKK